MQNESVDTENQVSLYHGDCLDVMAKLPDASVDMVLCDLPYGTTQNKWDSVIPLDALWREYRRIAKLSAAMIFTASGIFTAKLILSNEKHYKQSLVWEKSHATGFLNAKRMMLVKHEDIVVFYDKPPTYNPQLKDKPPENVRPIPLGDRGTSNYGGFKPGNHRTIPIDKSYPVSVIRIPNESKTATVHPTQKPVALMEYLIKTYSNPGDVVLDNCAGSFTTGVACLNTGRRFIGIEKDTEYYRIGVERMSEHAAFTLAPNVQPSCGMTDNSRQDYQLDLLPLGRRTLDTA